MNKQTPETVASAHLAVYNFFKFQIDIDVHDKELFTNDGKGGLDHTSKHYPVVWHEYVHYLQNIATTIGVRIFLNWVAVLSRFSAAAAKRTPLPVPLYMDPSNPFPPELNRLLAEIFRLMGSTTPLDMSPPSDVQAYTPYIDPKDGTHALLCIEESGNRIGVPLAGNAFIEGMAQGVQWLIEGNGQWNGGLLKGRKFGGPHVYYDAIIRYFEHHAPNVNPCIPAIIISHAALQTTQPAAFFYIAHGKGMADAAAKASMTEFAKAIRSHSHVKDGITSTLTELDQFETNNKSKAGTQFYDMVLEVVRVMRQGLTAYSLDATSFSELTAPTVGGLTALAQRFYFPPLYTKDIDFGWTINLTPGLKKLCALMAAMCSLAYDVNNTNLADTECPLLRKRYCTFPKNKNEYCHQNRLNFIEINGEVCAMGQAAQLLSINRKPLTRLK